MSAIDDACEAYGHQLKQPWRTNQSGPERVWMLVYRPDAERRLRHRLSMFETTTLAAGKRWRLIDITEAFETWMGEQEDREAYFEEPESMEYGVLDDFVEWLSASIADELDGTDEMTVVALLGAAGLFGLTRLSEVIRRVANRVRGRMLILFPGTRDDNNYRLLDGYDGWNYLAVAVN